MSLSVPEYEQFKRLCQTAKACHDHLIVQQDQLNRIETMVWRLYDFTFHPVKVVLTVKEMHMAGKMKLDLLDSGDGFQASVAYVDKANVEVPAPPDAKTPVFSLSDMEAFVLTPSEDGLSVVGKVPSPPKIVSGVILSVDVEQADGTHFMDDNSEDPLNVVTGPAGGVIVTVGAL